MDNKVLSALPLEDAGIDKQGSSRPAKRRYGRYILLLPVAMLLMFTGAVVGMYFQPPGLQIFYRATGLEPGGGTENKLAAPINSVVTEQDIQALRDGTIVALGKLQPKGEVSTIGMPYGAGDARVESLSVSNGDFAKKGTILAVLDNRLALENSVKSAEAEVLVSEASLEQVKLSIAASRAENEAELWRAEANSELASAELTRTKALYERKVATLAQYDRAKAEAQRAELDIARKLATVKRFETNGVISQADVELASRKLVSARTALETAKNNLEKSLVRAPFDGVVLEVLVQAGERPTSAGVLDFGQTQTMTAELEVYQNQIGRIALGDSVLLKAEALPEDLKGEVMEIGLQIGRQSLLTSDPAANTDARVVKVQVKLDDASSKLASRFTNLEVYGYVTSATQSAGKAEGAGQ
ncbi:HlyD family efflux transporter periplasmic adaptor subunit [Cohaesibacter gelatinilyticus]|uniref:HlyD family secretion protein n=1 Tax=Cohaesibacter gelatinilyticus TaxID=372072 RepID=A0A285PM11_9HYPH|nr:HlyD family efflux transporter periplasmic adaptor subunit [Cohaesibacter gelatinilyticus]SNZ20921.1 HlyD family secretion protein [Cohaesibacter gelatinilyticus]